MFKRTGTYIVFVAALLLCTVLSGCNARKKNTAAARQYTAFITRYNIYYNGDRHYSETLDEMERSYEDDFTRMLPVHPAEARADEKAPQPNGDFTRSIEKAQKAIQLRSITKKPAKKANRGNDAAYKAWMKREEYNPFLHNAWMMMGRSQYMNGDFGGAASTFFYTSRHFSWLPATVTEAQLWQARSYLAMDWTFEAETILNRIKPNQLTTPALKELYALDVAEMHMRRGQYAEAAPVLQQAVLQAKGAQKTRLYFLLGQVYERLDRKADAYAAFGKAASATNATYRTRFNARIRQSAVFTGTDIRPEVKALKAMTRLDRNADYLDQIYYAIGNLYLSQRDTTQAIENYEKGASLSKRNGIDKAILELRLGGLYYNGQRYDKAQPRFASAVPQLPASHPGLDSLKRISDVLDELALYSQNVAVQDSLLRLADMDSTQRAAVIEKTIQLLIKKEKEEAENAALEEHRAQESSRGSQNTGGVNNPAQFSINTDNSWYFYNMAARNAGRTEFQRRWGSRRLEDNWRRRNKSTVADAEFGAQPSSAAADSVPEDTEKETPQDAEAAARADDPHFAEYYLKQIPFTAEQKQTAHDVIQEGLYNMGVILKDKMDDRAAARRQFDRLLVDYPDNTYRLDVYYNLYLMAERSGDKTLAQRWRNMILANFPDSPYGIALRNPDYMDNLRQMDSRQNQLYDEAYAAYMESRNADVHRVYTEVTEAYPTTKLMPKFMFLEALAYVTERDSEKFGATLRQLLERYPDTDVAPVATAWLKGLSKGRKLQTASDGRNMRGMIWDISLSNDTVAADSARRINFTLNPADRHVLVMVFATDSVNSNALLYDLARHNFGTYVVKDFDLEQLNFGRLGMIVVRDFADAAELEHYRKTLMQSAYIKLPAGVRPVAISVPDWQALLNGGGSLDTYFRARQEKDYTDAQRGRVPESDIETLDSADNPPINPEEPLNDDQQ